MGKYTFNNPATGQSFTVSGPETLTEAQAKEVFNKQLSTGALVGLKPGDIINSAKQALGGVVGAIGSAISSVTGAISGALGKLPGLAKSLTGSAPTNPVNIGDIAKSAQGLMPIAGVNPNQITAGMAGLTKLVDQPASVISDAKGVGSFGLDANQLQTAGFLKPGTTNLLSDGVNSLSSVLKSPSVWTGKEGITNLQSLLANESAQSKIQQNLMATGAAGLDTLGINVSSLTPAAATGTLLNAAKSIPGTAAWAKGTGLPTDLKTGFDANAVAGSFGVNLSNLKTNGPMLEEEKIVGSTNTVNRETVNAATQRIIGNPKIPSLNYSNSSNISDDAFNSATLELNSALTTQFEKLVALGQQAIALNERPTITQEEYNRLLAARDDYRTFGSGTTQPMYKKWLNDYESLSDSEQRAKATIFNALRVRVQSISVLRDKVYKTIEDLLNKIA